MNVLLLSAEEAASGVVTLCDRRAEHVRAVLKAKVGDALVAGVIDGKLGTATVQSIDATQVTLALQLDRDPPPPLGIELLLALPRPKILRKVLQAAASMGCKRIALVGSYRVEKSYFGSPFVLPDAIRDELLLGLEQARDTRVPEVSVHRFFKPFIEDALEPLFSHHARLLPHPKAHATLPALDATQPAVLAIGPEGGWTEYEARALEEHGFAPFTAGPRVLRVDVAVPFLVGQLALARGR